MIRKPIHASQLFFLQESPMLSSLSRRSAPTWLALALVATLPASAIAEDGGEILDRMVDAVVKKVDLGRKGEPRPLTGSLSATFTAPSFGGLPIAFSATYKTRPPQDFQADITSAVGDYRVYANAKSVAIESTGDNRYFTTERKAGKRVAEEEPAVAIEDVETDLREWLESYQVVSVREVAGAPGGKAWELDLRPGKTPGEDSLDQMKVAVLQTSHLPWKIRGYSDDREVLTAEFGYQGGEPLLLDVSVRDSESSAKAHFDLAYDKAGILRALDGKVEMDAEGVLELQAKIQRKVQVSDADFNYRPSSGMRPASQEELTMLLMTRVMGMAIGAAMNSK
jgi:hypothetical protein